MPRARLQAPNAGGSADETEAAFYEALQRGDIVRLMACWADEDEIVCVHPGGPRILGPLAIRASFESIFANGSVRAFPQSVQRLHAMGCAIHSLIERVEVSTDEGARQALVVATNVYLKTAQGWRMIAHHASQGPDGQVLQDGVLQPLLH